MTIPRIRCVKGLVAGLIMFWLLTPAGGLSQETLPQGHSAKVGDSGKNGSRTTYYADTEQTAPTKKRPDPASDEAGNGRPVVSQQSIPQPAATVVQVSGMVTGLMVAAGASAIISCILVMIVIRLVLPKIEERLKSRIDADFRSVQLAVASGRDLVAQLQEQIKGIHFLDMSKALQVALENAGLTSPGVPMILPERITGLEVQLSEFKERVEGFLNQLNGQIEHQAIKVEQQMADVRRILDQSRAINEHFGKEPPEGRSWMRRYYPALLEKAMRGRTQVAGGSPENTSLLKLDKLRSHLLALGETTTGTAADLAVSYIGEIDGAMGHKTDLNKLKEEINRLIGSWDQNQYLRTQLERDVGHLLDSPSSANFISERLMTHEATRAVLAGMDRKIRELVWQGLAESGAGSPQAAKDLLRTFRTKIIDFVHGIDLQLSAQNEEFTGADAHIRGILECLGLEVLPVEVNREEYDDAKHFKVKSDPNSRYPHNTVVGVVRRGLRGKDGGPIHTKAQVIVAQRGS